MSARRTSSAETPLLAWGEALRTAKLHRKKLVRRGWCIAITSAAVLVNRPAILTPVLG